MGGKGGGRRLMANAIKNVHIFFGNLSLQKWQNEQTPQKRQVVHSGLQLTSVGPKSHFIHAGLQLTF